MVAPAAPVDLSNRRFVPPTLCLRGEFDEEACFTEFERRYRREFGVFYEFLLTFYDMNQDADSYFWSAGRSSIPRRGRTDPSSA